MNKERPGPFAIGIISGILLTIFIVINGGLYYPGDGSPGLPTWLQVFLIFLVVTVASCLMAWLCDKLDEKIKKKKRKDGEKPDRYTSPLALGLYFGFLAMIVLAFDRITWLRPQVSSGALPGWAVLLIVFPLSVIVIWAICVLWQLIAKSFKK